MRTAMSNSTAAVRMRRHRQRQTRVRAAECRERRFGGPGCRRGTLAGSAGPQQPPWRGTGLRGALRRNADGAPGIRDCRALGVESQPRGIRNRKAAELAERRFALTRSANRIARCSSRRRNLPRCDMPTLPGRCSPPPAPG